ncbi:nuclear apoptosis-inducing factor 1-like [Haliotis cracherodii]|uniref:nuclear apoptosis-inducing factor 1-like n=1 Tax=Haliotis cracherodii TaxID=6455 RepID=UPI0039EC14A1
MPDKKRKPNWSEDQNLLLTKLVDDNKAVLLGKFRAGVVTAQKKKEKWVELTHTINAAFPGCIRAPEEVEKKWHNIQSKAREEITRYKQGVISTGGGPSPCPTLSATSEVVWDILGKNNVSISGIPSAMDTSLLQVVSLSDTVNASEYSDMAALDLQTLQAMGGAVPTASTASVPSQPEPSVPDTASSTQGSMKRPARWSTVQEPKSVRQTFLLGESYDELLYKKLKLETDCLSLKKKIMEIQLQKLQNE